MKTLVKLALPALAVAAIWSNSAQAQLIYRPWSYYNYGNCASGNCSRPTATTQKKEESEKSDKEQDTSDIIKSFDNIASVAEEVVEQTNNEISNDADNASGGDSVPVASGDTATSVFFTGVDADKWQTAIEAVCDQRGIPLETIKARLGGRQIACYSSYSGSYAGCTWGADGSVSKVDIVPSNCYDVESVRRHEAAHVVTFLVDGASSLFVHEGMSQICERGGKRKTYLSKASRQMSESTNFVDWVDVNSYDSAYRVYTFSFAVFEYLREAGGSKWLECFVNEASETSFTSALYRWYGLTTKELNDNVKKLVEQDIVLPLI